MHKIRSGITRHPLLFLIGIYLLTRLPSLTLLPIFSDEANYLDWGWRGVFSGVPFHSLYDGKQPLLMWLFALGQQVFPDPLWGSRFISVLTGLSSVVAVYRIGHRFFTPKEARIAVLLYITTPLFFFFDRQALMESSLVSVSLWSLYFLIQLISRPTLITALITGAILGVGYFIKGTGLVFVVAAVCMLLGAVVRGPREHRISYLNSLLYLILSFLIITAPLLAQSTFWSTLGRNQQYAYSLSEMLRFPVSGWVQSLLTNLYVAFLDFSPIVFLTALIGIPYLWKQSLPGKLICMWALFTLSQYLAASRPVGYLSFRYLTPFMPPFLFSASHLFAARPKMALLSLLPGLATIITLLISPPHYFYAKSRITPYSYIYDYVNGLDTGYQVNAIRSFLNTQSHTRPIYIGMAVHAFNPEAAILSYYRKNPRATPAFIDATLLGDAVTQYDCIQLDRPLFFIAKLNDTAGLEKFLVPVTVITNPYNSDYSTIYTLKTDCTHPLTLYPSQ